MKGLYSTLCLVVCLSAVAQSTEAPAPASTTAGAAPSQAGITATAANPPPSLTPKSSSAPAEASPAGEEEFTTFVTELVTSEVDLPTDAPASQTPPKIVPTTPGGSTAPPPETCGGRVCGVFEECVNQTADDILSRMCQCLPDFIRLNKTACQDPATATCETVHCGESPADCMAGDDGVFIQCNCGAYQVLQEGICVEKNCENTEECHGPGDLCSDHHGGYMCQCGEGRTLNDAQTDCLDIPQPTGMTTSAGTDLTTAGPTQAPPTGGQGTTGAAGQGTTKAAGQGSTKTPDKVTPTMEPGKKPVPSQKSYKGPILGLFLFLIITTLVFVVIYVVRKRKMRNTYGRLDEDSTEGGWSAFSKNPIYRGDRDYQDYQEY